MRREVVATVRLDALRHNLRVVRRRCPHSRVIAMVKANGYGHGLLRTAQALGDADAIGVAVFSEAVALREAGFARPLVVFQGVLDAQEARHAAEHGIALVVHQREQVELLTRTSLPRPPDVWLKLDTGMHRLGLEPEQADAAVAALRPRVRALGVMTHFACADEIKHPLTPLQLERVMAFSRKHCLPASAANSAAILALPPSHLDVVRPGIMLYGSTPLPRQAAFEFDLQPVMSLTARVIAINPVPQGESVGYGATWRAPRDSRIGVIGIGYGDGYPRHAMPGAPVRIGNELVPLVGRVSMDMITVDLTAHPEVRLGDEAELWGEHVSVDVVARHAGTISYELLCRLTSRVRFDYVH
jgi:alanine racemase